jgi:PAS domain S-box-containing protein
MISGDIPLNELEALLKSQSVDIKEELFEPKRADLVQAFLASIVQSSNDAIIGKTSDGIIVSWNDGAEMLFGYRAEEIIGKPISTLIPPDRQEESVELLARLKRGERIEHFETVRIKKDGMPLDVSLSISPIKDGSGRIIGSSKVARDIRKRKRAETEREELLMEERAARVSAQAANRSKDELISLVSHELRSPLNSILIYCQILDSNPDDAEHIRQSCEIIERNIRTQLRLIEDLLDTSHIVRGRLRIDKRPTDIVVVIADALDGVRPLAEAKGIRLRAHYDPEPEMVIGDGVRLQQVIGNLLSNAIKFTPEGGRVDLWLERGGESLCITVSDTGAGIDKNLLPYILNRFYQKDWLHAHKESGLGLGLTLAKQLVELHDGTIEVSSDGKGYGSTFTVRLPLAWRTGLFGAEQQPALNT